MQILYKFKSSIYAKIFLPFGGRIHSLYLLFYNHRGHANYRRTEPDDGEDQGQGHRPRADGTLPAPPRGIPFSAQHLRPTRQAGHHSAQIPCRCLRPRLLLASAQEMQNGLRSQKSQEILGGQVCPECRQRPKAPPPTPASRVAGCGRMGMSVEESGEGACPSS